MQPLYIVKLCKKCIQTNFLIFSSFKATDLQILIILKLPTPLTSLLFLQAFGVYCLIHTPPLSHFFFITYISIHPEYLNMHGFIYNVFVQLVEILIRLEFKNKYK